MRILFCSGVITEGLRGKQGSRAGIFFVAINLLKLFSEREGVSVTLFENRLIEPKELEALLKSVFNITNVKVITPLSFAASGLENALVRLTAYKERKKHKKQFIRRGLLNAVLFFPKQWQKILGRDSDSRLAAAISGYDAAFTPDFKFPQLAGKLYEAPKRFQVLYDLIPWKLHDLYKSAGHEFSWLGKFKDKLSQEATYFCISNYTKQDFAESLPAGFFTAENCYVTYLAAADNFFPVSDSQKIAAVRAKYNIPQGQHYILSLCTIEPRKNLLFAIRNFIAFLQQTGVKDCVFALAGGNWGGSLIKTVQAEIEALGENKNKILLLGYVPDEDMAALYSGAYAFIYPSLAEGFGLPPLEAMQCGTPVITSNVTSIPEVVGDAAVLIDPHSDEECIAAFTEIYNNKALRKRLSERGLKRAKQFSWQKTADEMLAVMQRKSEIS